MSSVSMHHLFFSNGKVNFWGWGLFIATIAALAFTIYHCFVSIRKISRDERIQALKMAELEMNLRAVRGTSYQTTS